MHGMVGVKAGYSYAGAPLIADAPADPVGLAEMVTGRKRGGSAAGDYWRSAKDSVFSSV
jgi:hypothetical protein